MLCNRQTKTLFLNDPQPQIQDLCDTLGWTIEPVTFEAMIDAAMPAGSESLGVAHVPASIIVPLFEGRVEHGRARNRKQRRAALTKVFSAARRWLRLSRRQVGGA